MSPLDEATIKRFWAKIQKSDGCWDWIGSKNDDGYGNFWCLGRCEKAHRASWMIHFGPIPIGMEVLHRCDRPSCIRPDDLFLGTHTDNMRDAVRKGRIGKILTAEQVQAVRLFAATGMLQREIGALYGVTQSNISRILREETWTHV